MCFLEHGIAGATTDEIRARSRASIGSIYHHFGDKDGIAGELYLELLRDYQEGLLRELFRHRSARSGIEATVRHHLRWIRSKPDHARYLFLMREEIPVRSLDDRIAELNRHVAVELTRWAESRAIRSAILSVPADLFAALWLGPAQSFGRSWLAGRSKTSLDLAARVLADAAWKSLRLR